MDTPTLSVNILEEKLLLHPKKIQLKGEVHVPASNPSFQTLIPTHFAIQHAQSRIPLHFE